MPGDSEDTYPELPKLFTKPCENCGKGKVIETLQIGDKIYGRCDTCDTNDRIK